MAGNTIQAHKDDRLAQLYETRQFDEIHRLLQEKLVHPNIRLANGKSILEDCLDKNDLETAFFLVQAGADVDVKTDDGVNLIQKYLGKPHAEGKIIFLLTYGANIRPAMNQLNRLLTTCEIFHNETLESLVLAHAAIVLTPVDNTITHSRLIEPPQPGQQSMIL